MDHEKELPDDVLKDASSIQEGFGEFPGRVLKGYVKSVSQLLGKSYGNDSNCRELPASKVCHIGTRILNFARSGYMQQEL